MWQGGFYTQEDRISRFPPPTSSLSFCLHAAMPLQGASCSLEESHQLWPSSGAPRPPISLQLLLGLMNSKERYLERGGREKGAAHLQRLQITVLIQRNLQQ